MARNPARRWAGTWTIDAMAGLRSSVCNLSCPLPLVVHQFGSVEAGALLRVKRDVRPGLVRMPREKDSLDDAKLRIMRCEL